MTRDRATPLGFDLPAGSCDCHVHVFEPDRFPYAADRSYTPGRAAVGDLLRFEEQLGIGRYVLVQPSVYGTDNSAMLAGLQALGLDRARGIAVIDPARASRPVLERLHSQGVRGVRVNLATQGEFDDVVALERLRRAADSVGPLGWCVQLYANMSVVADIAQGIQDLGVPVVLDHFAGLQAGSAAQKGAFETVVALVAAGSVYVKLSAPYRASALAPDHADLDRFAVRLIEERPDRMVWASDWPHTGSAASRSGDLSKVEPFRKVDVTKALERLRFWVPNAGLCRQILVGNPERLYGFEPSSDLGRPVDGQSRFHVSSHS